MITPLDAVDEPASLVGLRGRVEALLPEVEIADVPPGGGLRPLRTTR